MSERKPNVLVLSGLDPSGGAGIQADIQAMTALGAHPLPVLTCLTVQDTRNVYGSLATDPVFLRRQLDCLANDTPIDAIKTGALGGADVVDAILDFLDRIGPRPLIVDPVLVAAGGGPLADDALRQRMQERLFARAELLTPNGPEACALTDRQNPEEAGPLLLQSGCAAVLVTGGHATGSDLTNRLYRTGQPVQSWTQQRLPGEFHGSGCTLAAAIAAGRSAGLSLEQSIEQAQHYIALAVSQAYSPGQGQQVPERLPRGLEALR